MKFSMPIVLIVLMVGLLALVQPVNATGYMDGANWTGISSIGQNENVSIAASSDCDPTIPPYQVTPLITRLNTCGNYSSMWVGNNYHVSSYVQNYGYTPTVGTFSMAISSGANGGQVWGLNTGAYVNTSNATGHAYSAEFNYGKLVASTAQSRGINIVSVGNQPTDEAINIFSNTNGTQPNTGIYYDVFHGTVQPINASGSLISTATVNNANGIDFRAADFSNGAILLNDSDPIMWYQKSSSLFASITSIVGSSAESIISIDPKPASTKNSEVRFFRNTASNGTTKLLVYPGNNSGVHTIALYGNNGRIEGISLDINGTVFDGTNFPNNTVAANLANWNATNYTELNTKVNKSGDIMTGTLTSNVANGVMMLYSGNTGYIGKVSGSVLAMGLLGGYVGQVGINTQNILFPTQYTSVNPPTYVRGGIYFDNVTNTTMQGTATTYQAVNYNASYANSSLPFTIENGTNVIGADYSNFFTTGNAGTLTKLIAHSTQSGSINISFWNASNSNAYIGSVDIAAGTDASTVLDYAFADETRIMFNITGAVTDIKQVGLTVKATKS